MSPQNLHRTMTEVASVAPTSSTSLSLVIQMRRFQLNSSVGFNSIPLPLCQRLPYDTLYHLFCVFMEHFEDDPRLGPILSHVCRSWRFAALHTPALWKYVRMDCTRKDQHQLWPKTQLNRGRLAPVVFELFITRDLSSNDIEPVMTHAHRFRKLIINIVHPLFTRYTMKMLQMPFPLLEEFEYKVNGVRRLVLSRNVSPNDPFYLPLITRDFEAKWELWSTKSLTTLSFMHMKPGPCPTLAELRAILESCCETLQHFKYHGLAPEFEQSEHPVTLPNLQSLSFGYADDLRRVIQLIHAPSLKSLELRDLYIAPDSHVQHDYLKDPFETLTSIRIVFTILTDSFPELTSLELWGTDTNLCPLDTAFDFLVSFPKLRRLALYAHTQPTMFQIFFEPDAALDAPPPFPHLSELMVSGYYGISRYLQRRVHAGYQKMEKLVVTSSCLLEHKKFEFKALLDVFCQTTKRTCVVTDPAFCDYSPVRDETEVIVDGNVLPDVVLYSA